MKKASITLILILIVSSIYSQKNHQNKALNNRSDTIDILDYQINLDITDLAGQSIKGSCKIIFTPKLNGINAIGLDLLKLNIDSITSQNSLVTFSYNDTLISATLPSTLNNTDTSSLTVYYGGNPLKDGSGWGGFYFDGNYAYNLGVGFDANPHNYGRVWFPCFDNFVEHSTYQFNIVTSNGKNAHCNGYLDTTYTITGDTIMNSWIMADEIPTYLACVAVSDYETVRMNFNGINNVVPVEFAARAADTTNMKNSFVNLNNAFDAYEDSYGPYAWNKIGYSLVPFSSGAMEHATNIAYPQVTANGALTYETLMAHEFSHHWWGDLVTCETAGDMWINEGMAVYSEHLFLEKVYDYPTSLAEIKTNHKDVIQFTHLHEGGYRAISGIPHQYTYGEHVYNKGASVVHNMRAYLGDSLFFVGLKSITTNYYHKNINSSQFRDELTSSTGIDMTNFFNDWVFAPGFSHFNIDSNQVTPNGGSFDVTLFVQQKLRGTTNYHTGTPLVVSFYDANWNKFEATIVATGQFTTTTVSAPFTPSVIFINEQNKLNQARTDNQLILSAPFNSSLVMSMISNLNVSSISDSALLQIEHHWVAPDTIKNNPNNYRISTSRYWSIDGLLPTNFYATAQINFDGRAGTGFLDLDLVPVNGDSIILLYRKDAHDDWVEYPYYTKTSFSSIAFGFVVIDSLMLGEYTFANSPTAVGIEDNNKISKTNFEIYPNPADKFIWIENKKSRQLYSAKIYDITGKLIIEKSFNDKIKLNTSNLKAGNYIIAISDVNKSIYSKKIIIK